MTPKAIIAVLDKTAKRINLNRGLVEWSKQPRWFARFDEDNEPVSVAWEIRPGVWLERETKFSTAHLPA